MKDSESLQNHHLSQIRAIDKMHVEHLFMPDAVFTEEYLNSRHKQNQSQLQLNAADFERAQEVALKETLGGDQGRNKLAELALGQNSSLVENLKPILQYIDNLSGHALNFRNDQGELYIKEELIKWQDKTDEEDSTFSEQILTRDFAKTDDFHTKISSIDNFSNLNKLILNSQAIRQYIHQKE